MTILLRPYQFDLKQAVNAAWLAGFRNVLMRSDTGSGKTRVLASIIDDHPGASCVIAHRHEIVSQISLALAECGVRHNIIASRTTCDAIAALHVRVTGRNYYDPGARCAVASVATLARRKGLEAWAAQVTLWVVDEGHHLVEDNTWHRAISMFTNPNVRGLLPTATPKRADGKGLGRPPLGDGVADYMVEGPAMRWLIDEGYLTDYRIICADSHIRELLDDAGASGDWSTAQLKAATEQSPIIGDVVKTYRAVNNGYYAERGIPASNTRVGIVFASDVTTAGKMLLAYRADGLRAELVTGETDPGIRRHIFDSLERGTIDIVIAVDIVSEGTDIPALQLGIFGRATMSLAVYMQQIGRLLRPLMTPAYKAAQNREERLAAIVASPKPYAIVIDHVGNFLHHGPPDRPRVWSLERTGRRSNGPTGAIPSRACLNPRCGQPYLRTLTCCPYCGTDAPEPAGRSTPAMVEGDMVMLDPEVLAALRGEVDELAMSVDDYRAGLAATGLPQRFVWHNAKTFAEKHDMQEGLRAVMALWGGRHHAAGASDREMQRLFYFTFGVDVMTAQTLGPVEAEALLTRIYLDDGYK